MKGLVVAVLFTFTAISSTKGKGKTYLLFCENLKKKCDANVILSS